MGRTLLPAKRLSGMKELNLGHIILFCEGKTEKYYLDYFAQIIEKNKYADLKIVLEDASGNARRVLNFANSYLAEEDNNRRYSNYEKYLVFDCDAPNDIQAVILAAKDYKLLISNYLFEVWLLMHFENVEEQLSKREIYKRLADYLDQKYIKGHKGKMREIIQKGDVVKAIDNAKLLCEKYKSEGMHILTDIKKMNPYSNLYELIESLMYYISVGKVS